MAFNIEPLPDPDHGQVVPYRRKPVVPGAPHETPPHSAASGSCSVVMVSFRTGPVLLDSLRAALSDPSVDRVVLVDNGNGASIRRSVDALAADAPRLTIIRGHGNVGFARGCNLGVAKATGQFLLLLNPDCILRPGVISRGIEVLLDRPEASALTVRIENSDGSEQRGGRRNLMTPWTCLVEQFRLDRLMPNHPHFQRLNLNETEPLSEVSPVQCISGAFMLMPKSAYAGIGGMDEDYFLHAEDVDLCFRIRKQGGEILYVPDVAVTHVKGTSRVFPLIIEWHKSVSVAKYFRKHFRPQYPDLVLRLIGIALLLRLAVRSVPVTIGWLRDRLQGSSTETRSMAGGG